MDRIKPSCNKWRFIWNAYNWIFSHMYVAVLRFAFRLCVFFLLVYTGTVLWWNIEAMCFNITLSYGLFCLFWRQDCGKKNVRTLTFHFSFIAESFVLFMPITFCYIELASFFWSFDNFKLRLALNTTHRKNFDLEKIRKTKKNISL